MPPRKTSTSPLPTELLALLRACKEEPDDDGPRLVLADWLEDHGQTERAEFVRVQVELRRLEPSDPRLAPLTRLQDELLQRHRKEWSIPFGRKGVAFHRGLLCCFGQAGRLLNPKLARPSTAAAWAWVEILHLHGVSEKDAGAVASCPLLDSVGFLAVSVVEFAPESAARLAGTLTHSPHLSGLRHLSLGQCRLGGEGLRLLTTSPYLGNLTTLGLGCNGIDDHVAILARWDHPPPLRTLDFQFNQIGNAGVTALADWPALKQLTRLNLNNNRISARGFAALVGSAHLGNLRELSLGSNPLGPGAGQALNRPASWSGLSRLDLSRCGIEDRGVAALTEAAWLGGLTDLNLAYNKIGPTGLRVLVRSPGLARLTTLILAENPLGPEGARLLAESPYLANLRELHLAQTGIDARGARALASSPHLGRLRTLALGENQLGDEGALALAGASGLGKLSHLYLANCALTDAGAQALADSTCLDKLTTLYLLGWSGHPSANRLNRATVKALRARTDKRVFA
jgi:uncharacterized protein (TIGR02996 family)